MFHLATAKYESVVVLLGIYFGLKIFSLGANPEKGIAGAAVLSTCFERDTLKKNNSASLRIWNLYTCAEKVQKEGYCSYIRNR